MRTAVSLPGHLYAQVYRFGHRSHRSGSGHPVVTGRARAGIPVPKRILRRPAGALLLTAVLAALACGCAQQGEESPLMSLRRTLPEDTTLRLPNTPPPALIDAGLSSGDGTPIVSFYSLNEPIVSVCQAPPDQCLRLLPTAEVIPRADSQTGVTVLIEAQETGAQMALSEALRRYWSAVDLVAGRPAWLDRP